MDYTASIEAIEQYREKLGDELVEFFKSLWTLQDTLPQFGLLEGLRSVIALLASYHEGFKTAALPLFSGNFTLEYPDPLDAKNIETLINDLCRVCAIEPDTAFAAHLAFAVISAVQPHSDLIAKQTRELSDVAVQSGICPHCGSPAALGILSNTNSPYGGSRELWCSLCGHQWEFTRGTCVRCGNNHQSELKYYLAKDDRAHRVYGCDLCGGFLKVVSETDLGHACNARVEELILDDLLEAVAAGNAQPQLIYDILEDEEAVA